MEYQVKDETGTEEYFEADSEKDLRTQIRDWVREGAWGDRGCTVTVYYGEVIDGEEPQEWEGSIDVNVAPNHEVFIEDVLPDDCESLGCCGMDPEDHEWVATFEGVHSLGGTAMSFSSHCKNCGLTRSEKHTGPQRNPGEPEETVSYDWVSDWRERWGY